MTFEHNPKKRNVGVQNESELTYENPVEQLESVVELQSQPYRYSFFSTVFYLSLCTDLRRKTRHGTLEYMILNYSTTFTESICAIPRPYNKLDMMNIKTECSLIQTSGEKYRLTQNHNELLLIYYGRCRACCRSVRS